MSDKNTRWENDKEWLGWTIRDEIYGFVRKYLGPFIVSTMFFLGGAIWAFLKEYPVIWEPVGAVALTLGTITGLALRDGRKRRRLPVIEPQSLPNTLPKMVDDTQTIVVASPKQEKVFVDLTPEQLIAFHTDNTGIQANKLVAPSIGKWMPISGRLSNVLSSYPGFAQLTFIGRGVGNQVFMYFRDQKLIDRLSMLKPGTQMTVHGQIEMVDMLAVHLGNCELIRVES
jgi:hypothetical protein